MQNTDANGTGYVLLPEDVPPFVANAGPGAAVVVCGAPGLDGTRGALALADLVASRCDSVGLVAAAVSHPPCDAPRGVATIRVRADAAADWRKLLTALESERPLGACVVVAHQLSGISAVRAAQLTCAIRCSGAKAALALSGDCTPPDLDHAARRCGLTAVPFASLFGSRRALAPSLRALAQQSRHAR